MTEKHSGTLLAAKQLSAEPIWITTSEREAELEQLRVALSKAGNELRLVSEKRISLEDKIKMEESGPVISHRIDHGEGAKLLESGALWNDIVSRCRSGHLMACGWCGKFK